MLQKFRSLLLANAAVVGAVLLLLAPLAHASALETSGRDPLPVRAGAFALKVENGLAIPLSDPQSRLFKLGGAETIKVLFALTPFLDFGAGVTFVALPSDDTRRDLGTAWAVGGGLQFKRPHDAPNDDKFFAISPWADIDMLYVRTGALNRPGFAVAAGLAIPIGASRIFWLGPFVRYFHIIQPEKSGYDNHDAKSMILGVSLEIGSGVQREPEAVSPAEDRFITKKTFICPDRDDDGFPDNVDHCPDVSGPVDNWGCPDYEKLVIHRDNIELKEKIFFAWDQAVIEELSFPLLDEVVQAMKDNKSFQVQIDGHTDSTGVYDYNQGLSEERAEAVLDYLVSHGVSRNRLVSKGFSESQPIDTNATVEGRENNRRVEFVVFFNIINKEKE